MSVDREKVEQMIRNSQGIPSNPEIAAKIAQDTTPLVSEPSSFMQPSAQEQGLNEEPASVDFFGGLAADMDNEVNSYAEPVGKHQVDELPYVAPIHQRQSGEAPESLTPRIGEEHQQFEAAIEQPLVEDEIRYTADQWAQHQQSLQSQQEPANIPQNIPVDQSALEEKAVEHLMTTMYALSEDDKNALISEPDAVFPRLAARMHVNVQVQTAQQIAQILPGMMQSFMQKQSQVQDLEAQFFNQYPSLSKPEYRQTVAQSLSMIRQINPKASRSEVMKDGAALAAVRLKQKLGTGQQPPSRQPSPTNMPLAAPMYQQSSPFTPAQSGGGTEPVVPNLQNSSGIFAQLAEDIDW